MWYGQLLDFQTGWEEQGEGDYGPQGTGWVDIGVGLLFLKEIQLTRFQFSFDDWGVRKRRNNFLTVRAGCLGIDHITEA